MRVAVIELGKIGLPLAVQYATNGQDVVGIDLDPNVVQLLRDGLAPFPGEQQLSGRLSEVRASGRPDATCAYSQAIPGR